MANWIAYVGFVFLGGAIQELMYLMPNHVPTTMQSVLLDLGIFALCILIIPQFNSSKKQKKVGAKK